MNFDLPGTLTCLSPCVSDQLPLPFLHPISLVFFMPDLELTISILVAGDALVALVWISGLCIGSQTGLRWCRVPD